MPRPPIEVADVIRAAGESFFESRPKWFSWLHLKVLQAILCCLTAALGGQMLDFRAIGVSPPVAGGTIALGVEGPCMVFPREPS